MIYVICLLTITTTVLVHYESLRQISLILPKLKVKHRLRILFGVFACLFAHAVELSLFALVYYFLAGNDQWGHLKGNFDGSWIDSIYFSYTTFTTLGLGDIEPHGSLKILVGVESLTGLLLITWTASFLFREMQRYWDDGSI